MHSWEVNLSPVSWFPQFFGRRFPQIFVEISWRAAATRNAKHTEIFDLSSATAARQQRQPETCQSETAFELV